MILTVPLLFGHGSHPASKTYSHPSPGLRYLHAVVRFLSLDLISFLSIGFLFGEQEPPAEDARRYLSSSPKRFPDSRRPPRPHAYLSGEVLDAVLSGLGLLGISPVLVFCQLSPRPVSDKTAPFWFLKFTFSWLFGP